MAAEAVRANDDYAMPAAGTSSPRKLSLDPYWSHFRDVSADRWEAKVLPKVLEITTMEQGWDGYDAPAIPWDACIFALQLLNNGMRATTPIPQVVPTSSGALQLEWHERQIDLELKVSAPYKCEVFYQDLSKPAQEAISIAISADLTPLMRMMDELSSR